ncbi:OprO/OprP family phosphate-selective porin [Bdellovibrio sp. PAP01]|uniref:OprO/OprP family phosphate-selective porin n=1 Tax=Bdellovibrio svalbardensis TaxID=2972972 RepID=A0ABT6DG24_9BACT|nr:OprO/OprP family phosphate-selective porin [Bdellovibrio svalbardensis]
MKTLVLFFCVVICSEEAFSQKMVLDLRLDGRGTDYNSAAEADGRRDYYKFYLQTARLNLSDTLFEDISYRVRWRLSGRNQGNVTKRDSTNLGLDLAYVTVKTAPAFTVTVGKFLSEVGGYEGALSGPEIYFLSEANGGTSYLNNGVHLTGADVNVYYTGAKLTWLPPNQYLAFHIANNNTAVGRNESFAVDAGDSLDNGTFDQDRSIVGLVYNNSALLGPAVQTLMSVHYSNPGQGTNEALYLALGGQFTFDQWMIQADLLQDRFKSKNLTAVYDDSISSLVLGLQYKLQETTTLQLRLYESQEVLGGSPDATNRYHDAGLIWEHYRINNNKVRYHFAYFYRAMDSDISGSSQRTEQDIIVGVRIMTDIFRAFEKKPETL